MDALSLIKQFEGFSNDPYWDVNAYRAGYGSDTVTRADGSIVPVRQGVTVSREDAERDLSRRVLTEFQPSARGAIGGDVFDQLTDGQRSVLTSLAYNYGTGAWADDLSGVVSAIQSRDREGTIAAIRALGAHNNGINAGRRNREADIFGAEQPQPQAQAQEDIFTFNALPIDADAFSQRQNPLSLVSFQ
jgi:GH24 family phage-related lysozyme (muramidase)